MGNRLVYVSWVKGLCILLMVVGHVGGPPMLYKWIYLFHMPCFFFVSGYLMKPGYLEDATGFLKSRIRGLYVPFVKWSLIFLLLHNVFARIGIYDNRYGWGDFVRNGLGVLVLDESEKLLGGYWFLKELLFASMVSYGIIWLLKRIGRDNWKWVTAVALMIVAAAFGVSFTELRLPIANSKTMLAISYFMLGYALKRKEETGWRWWSWTLVAAMFVATAVAAIWVDSSINVRGWLMAAYWPASMMGIAMAFGAARLTEKRESRVMRFVNKAGEESLFLLTFHFLAFKAVDALKIMVTGLPWERLSDFPNIRVENEWFWVLYAAAGFLLLFMKKDKYRS